MVFFHQTSSLGLLKSLKKSHIFYPMPKHQQMPIVLGCFIFTSSYQCAKPVDPKRIRPGTTTLSFKGKGEGIRETRVGKDYSSPRPFNLFAAGASKRRSGPREAIEDSERSILSRRITLHPPEKPLSAGEWEELKGQFEGLRKFELLMFEQMIACNSPIDVAKSLLAAVANREGDIQYSILLKYLCLCVSQGSTEEIYDVHDILKARFKTLETSGYGLLIRGLSGTPRWREALSLLEELKKVMTPSKSNYGDCIRGALLNREINLACELFHEMLAKDLVPNLDTLQIFFDTGRSVKDDILKTELMHILSYLRDNQVYPGEALMQSIKQWFESIPGENWKGSLTTIKHSGQCPSCNQSLESINLSPEEYSTLKERIIKDVIQGTDTFRKTTPQELEEFQTFVNQCPPFDIVIDGLNVSRVYNKAIPSQTLLNVVSYLAQQNPRMLILGRKHMLKKTSQWHRNDMAALQKKAHFFFTENLSEDDPFLLYATLHSGSHCRFVTRDLLRDHKACLSDSLTRRLFFKWQRGHQMVLSDYIPGKRIKFESVLNFDTIVQTTGNTWHIPYDDNVLKRSSYEVPTKWLCLQQK
ncbi:mitochondrial ribonuclease P catalytic subunit isoform X1 [Podarcis raffonei]|uniref:mitochondrial ribonuclease P catalytic subunit isoform X1 n=1 Tax=Podarcis raffonei TaxID=65483 RepID=UPI0023291D30|nr:mitochondrial ribonuclease P catalytic subunit isoform X1 [Podarcis raffonei]XP_053236251.1 mitochondrial ribonuclease P catalytic subunit isoform X1 [Podarcis raffonei]